MNKTDCRDVRRNTIWRVTITKLCAIKLHNIAWLRGKEDTFGNLCNNICHVLRYANFELFAYEEATRLLASFVRSSRDPVGWVSAPCRLVWRTGMQPGIESVISGQLLHCVFLVYVLHENGYYMRV